MKAKDLAFTVVVIVLIALTPNSPISVLARDVLADANPAPLAAPIGTSFTYQGQLMEDGVPADGVYDFQFTLWDAETSGSQIGSPVDRGDVVVVGGIFTVELDFGASAFAGEARWLEIGVRPGDSSGSYTTLDPRQKITPMPYAIYAANVDTLDSQHSSAFATSAHNHWGQTWTGSGTGLTLASTSGTALTGSSTATTGVVYGVYGSTASTSGSGMYGLASATTGTNYGVKGKSDSPSGYGVYGDAAAASGTNYGVYGRTSSPDGYGVVGNAAATSGANVGVFGRSVSPDGVGVYGWNSATSGNTVAVYGRCSSPTCNAFYAAHDSPSGYAVYFQGNLAGTGTKAAIVETRDYGWRTMYAVESPQNWFEDFGQATLVAGEATVAIEPVFAQTVNLEKPYHVFLTPLGEGCTLFVEGKSTTAFTVRANEGAGCEIAFDYRIVAPRLEYEDLRLRQAEDPQAVAASIPDVK